ncbi:MAG: type III pantothenate kinase [Nevskiales bacterium]
MKLLFDIGNTRLRAAWSSADGLRPIASVVHVDAKLPEVLAALKLSERPAEIWVASVAAAPTGQSVLNWAREKFDLAAHLLVSSRECCGVKNSYADPSRLGVDRWLAIIAAHHRALSSGGGPACVVSAGTAVTFDMVDENGQHLGGLIAPGVGSQRRYLLGATGMVRPQAEIAGLDWLGSSTEQALAYGTAHSVLGLIERASSAAARKHPTMRWLISGGEAESLLPHLPSHWEHAPLLVFEGLARVAAGGSS